jgi:hypothetical protein
MVQLETLNLANNRLTLLPRNINAMTKLVELNLSRYFHIVYSCLFRNIAFTILSYYARNLLRSLPVEFTEVLESVSNVDLSENVSCRIPPGLFIVHRHYLSHFHLCAL